MIRRTLARATSAFTFAAMALAAFAFSASAWAANPQVIIETTAGTIKAELYPRRRTKNRRQLPAIREGWLL